jgi:arylsulfatase A-like enzyme
MSSPPAERAPLLPPLYAWPLALRAAPLGAGAGGLSGGFELLRLAMGGALPLTFGEGAALAACAVLLGAVTGAVFGLLCGVLVGLPRGLRAVGSPKAQGLALGLTAAALGLFHMQPAMALKLQQGLPTAALSLGLANLGVFGVIYFNAAYWLRREEIGERRRLGFTLLGPAAGLLLGLACAASVATRSYGSAAALEDDPSVVLITVEGLGLGQLGVEAGLTPGATAAPAPAPGSPTPALDRLAHEGVLYTGAVAPAPVPALAVAGAMTGLHPARLGLLTEGHRLALGPQTVAERLRLEGWAAGAFVGSLSVAADGGLDRGFAAYDDLLWTDEGAPAGLERLRVVEALTHAVFSADPAAAAALRWRSDAETAARAARWIAALPPRPAFLWVHLSGPAQGAPIAETDAAVGALRAAVDAWRGERPVLWAVAGTGGPLSAGERLGGLSEAHLRAPIIVLSHKLTWTSRLIDKSVRLTDLGPTVLDRLGFRLDGKVEGADLLGFAEGTKTRGYATLLYAPRPGGSVSWGMRTPTADGLTLVKLLVLPEGERMFDLSADPGEQAELSARQPEAAAALRGLITAEQAKNGEARPVGDRPAGVRAALGAP